MTENCWASENANVVGLWGISDPDGVYVSVNEPYDGHSSPQIAAKVAAKRGLQFAQDLIKQSKSKQHMKGTKPDLVWFTSAPGNEECAIDGVQEIVGKSCAIVGGSSADNTVEGKWSQFASENATSGQVHCSSGNGITLAICYPSVVISSSFFSGYSPSDKSGIITKGQGRKIEEIDGRPAADVYNEWTGGELSELMQSEAAFNVLGKSTM
jgi:hypothetical protein